MKYNISDPDIGEDERDAVECVAQSGWLTMGPRVLAFEAALALYHGVRPDQVVCVNTGTAALHLALAASGVGPGDEVIVPNLTYVASANAVRYCGAKPVFVDVDPASWTIDVEAARNAITPRTRAVLAVHLYGVACAMYALKGLCKDRRLALIEDNAEGFTGTYSGQALGTFGEASALSFYGNKILTTGEGGAVVCRDAGTAIRVRSLRGQAQDPSRRFYHREVGFNYRMTDIAAAIGMVQFSKLPNAVARRTDICKHYAEALPNFYSPWVPPRLQDCEIAPWLYTCLLPQNVSRDRVIAMLAKREIETRPMFVPMNEQPPYLQDGEFDVSASVSRRGISLPTHMGLLDEDVEHIASVLRHVVEAA